MANIEIYDAQKALNTCTDHEHEEVEMYCRTCGKAVCTRCVKGEHKEHDWDTLSKIAKELRKQTNQQKLEVESASKSILIGIKEMLDSLASEAETELTSNRFKLESRRKNIVEFVNKRIDEMKSKCENNYKLKLDRIQERTKQVELQETRIKCLIENMDIGAKDYTDTDLIELHDEIYGILFQLQGLAVPLSDFHDRIVFRPGSSDMEILETWVGTMEEDKPSPELMLEKELKMSDTAIKTLYISFLKMKLGHVRHQ